MYGRTHTRILITAWTVFSSTMKGIESMSFLTNSFEATFKVLSSNKLISRIRASPAKSFRSVVSRYLTREAGK
jgi:hypothetical protein